jgi:hypothetical protein
MDLDLQLLGLACAQKPDLQQLLAMKAETLMLKRNSRRKMA